ncbi:MAG: RNA-binding S4 domain-containing protein [Desulfobacterales bacterium]|nr:RNA-binding S4 domain-containing protein [Desulfobacterales bacterium]
MKTPIVCQTASEPIELYKILKLVNVANSGGEAKYLISEGKVLVNGKVETRKRKKIFSGDVVEFGEKIIRVQVK